MGRDLTLNERRYLDRLHHTKLNYDLTGTEEFTPENGWYVDDYCVDLGSECPGPPESDGTWETAVRLVKDYEFAHPSIVRAFYCANEPLAERTMLLKAKFYGLPSWSPRSRDRGRDSRARGSESPGMGMEL